MYLYSSIFILQISPRKTVDPKFVEHHPQVIACKEGTVYFSSSNPNSNILVGAVVGGPTNDDQYTDERVDFRRSEPTTYINAPFVGVLAYFAANPT